MIYKITEKYVSNKALTLNGVILDLQRQERFFPEQQARIKAEAKQLLDGRLSEVDQIELIGLVSSRMVIEDFAKKSF